MFCILTGVLLQRAWGWSCRAPEAGLLHVELPQPGRAAGGGPDRRLLAAAAAVRGGHGGAAHTRRHARRQAAGPRRHAAPHHLPALRHGRRWLRQGARVTGGDEYNIYIFLVGIMPSNKQFQIDTWWIM